MKYATLGMMIFALLPSASFAQRRIAESGFYPPAFYGSTFTGVLTNSSDETRELVLTYTEPKSGKTQSFVGELEESYTIKTRDGKLVEVLPSQIKPGVTLKAYYMTQERKIEGQKVKVNVIFEIKGFANQRERRKEFKPFKPETKAEIIPNP